MRKGIVSLLILVVVYILWIFLFPSVFETFGNKFGLAGFNAWVKQVYYEIRDFWDNYDIEGKYKQTKDSALEIKQNVSKQVDETKQKIEDIQQKADETTKAIQETTQAVNTTIQSIQELWGSVSNLVPGTSTWSQ